MYTDYYRFSEKPFESNPDPRFFYLAPSNQKIFASVLTWIREGDGFAVVTGEAGVGKTFFINALVRHLDESIIPVLILNPVTTFKNLLEQIFLGLKRPTREGTEADLFDQFTESLALMKAQSKSLLTILDEAQDLNDQILRGLERLADLRENPIRIIFVGNPDLNERLNAISARLRKLGQKITAKRHLEPFTERESRGYIDHRLRLVGGSSEIITPGALSMICSYTRGISTSINHVCDYALWVGWTLNRERIDVDIIEKVIQNLEGPRTALKTFPPIQPIRQAWKSLIQFAIAYKRILMTTLLLLCLGGIAWLLSGHLGLLGPMKIQEIKSSIGKKLTTRLSRQGHSVQGKIEDILRKDGPLTSKGPKLIQPESSSLRPDAVFPTPVKGKQELNEVIVVKRGENLSLVANKYYHVANPTLIDLILQSNPEITNANLITVDQRIRIPRITEESLVSQSPDQAFKVHVGTFWSSELPKLYHDEPALNGKDIEIISLKVSPTDIFYRVLVGTFKDRDEALNMVVVLKKKGLLPAFESGFKTD